MKQYYIFKDNQKIGPISGEQLSQLGLNPNSMVWVEGMPQWLPASQVPELAQYMTLSTQPHSTPLPPLRPLNQQPQSQSSNLPLTDEPLTKSQKIARGFLFFPIAFMLLIGVLAIIGCFAGIATVESDAVWDNGQFSAAQQRTTLFLFLIQFIIIITICVISFKRLIKGHRHGLITICFFVLCYISYLILKENLSSILGDADLLRRPNVYHYYKLIHYLSTILNIATIVLAIFAAIPIEKMGKGSSYKKLVSDSSTRDYLLLGMFVIVTIIIFIMITNTGLTHNVSMSNSGVSEMSY